jgi:DNA-binding MarR family transcriptional regulator
LRLFVRYGIVRVENMRPLTFKVDSETTEFRADANGYLFDPRMRELLIRTGRRVDPGTEALAAVRILGKKMHALMERWADRYGLSEGRFQILVRLHHVDGGRIPMGELAEMLDVSPRTVTGLVDNLERDGLVKRVDDPDDRRSIYAEITDEGRQRLKALWRDATSLQAGLTEGVSESEFVQLRHACLRLIQTISAEESKSHAAS